MLVRVFFEIDEKSKLSPHLGQKKVRANLNGKNGLLRKYRNSLTFLLHHPEELSGSRSDLEVSSSEEAVKNENYYDRHSDLNELKTEPELPQMKRKSGNHLENPSQVQEKSMSED